MTATTETRVRLTGWVEEIEDSVRALLFGEMLCRAGGVQHYRSDLFHDAQFLARLDGPATFYWATRQSGTIISRDKESVEVQARVLGADAIWRIELTCERGEWFATFTEL
ncbi:MAG: hypothetical protein ACYCTE_17170 [Acidimicrobiales bacterium]